MVERVFTLFLRTNIPHVSSGKVHWQAYHLSIIIGKIGWVSVIGGPLDLKHRFYSEQNKHLGYPVYC